MLDFAFVKMIFYESMAMISFTADTYKLAQHQPQLCPTVACKTAKISPSNTSSRNFIVILGGPSLFGNPPIAKGS